MLTDPKAKNAKAVGKPLKLTDAGGLYLHVTTAGAKVWRLRCTVKKKEQTLTIGHYPDISLAEARTARDKAKIALRKAGDPREAIKEAKATAEIAAANTFETLAMEWYAQRSSRWTLRHAADVIGSLKDHVFPTLGAKPVDSITPKMVLDIIRTIESRPALETAHRVRQRMSAVFLFAIASGRGSADPAAIVKGALIPRERGHQPAVTDLEGVRAVLEAAEQQSAYPGTQLGLRLLALTAVRPGELRCALVDEFEEDVWRIPGDRMKMRREHIVPLSRQAMEVVSAARTLVGRGSLLFPSTRHAQKPMSQNALGHLLARAGYYGRHVPHGFRAAFSSIMNERHHADRDVIDLMLAHAPKDRVEAAYNRATYLDRRRELAQEWADLLLVGFKPASDLIGGRRRSNSIKNG